MAKTLVNKKVWDCVCEKCQHPWQSSGEAIPVICPKCKTKKWDEVKR